MSIKTWIETAKEQPIEKRGIINNQMIWMQQEIDELRAAYEALIGKYHELKARSEIDSRTVEAQAKRIDNIKPFLLDCASSDFVCTSQTLRDKANELLDMLNGE